MKTKPTQQRCAEQIRGSIADPCHALEDLAFGQVEMYESPRSEYVGDPSSLGHIIHGEVVMPDDSHILSIDSRNDLATELAAELRRVAKIHTDLADQVECKTRGTAAAAAHRDAIADRSKATAVTPEKWADGSPLFAILLCDAGQWEIVHTCESRSEANAWVDEWDNDNLGLPAIVWPTWAPVNLAVTLRTADAIGAAP